MKASAVLTRDEIHSLVEASDLLGFLSLATDWGLIAASVALVGWWPSPVTVVVALVIIGGRQLGLAVLMHECAHRSLFRTPWLNDVVGRWLIAAPVWQDIPRYRAHHLKHHVHANTDEDPDLGLIAAYPTSRGGLARKLARDLLGIAGLRRILGTLLIDLGFLTYTASTGAKRRRPTVGEVARNVVVRLGPVALTNAALLGVCWAVGKPWLYLLWVGANLTVFSLVLRVRAIAEHAGLPRTDDPVRNTRTTRAGPLVRLVLAPHHVNYHLEHHLLMTVPHYRLPAMHALLRERGVLDDSNHAPGYLAVLRRVVE